MPAIISKSKAYFRCGLLLFLTITLLTGCRKEEIRVYRVPKEESRAPLASVEVGAPEQIRWETPQGWVEQEAGGMRAARLAVNGKDGFLADVSVVPMPGISASKKDIVNLWREQVRLAPLEDSDVSSLASKVPVGHEVAELFDMVSDEPLPDRKQKTRILVAMLNRSGTAWFFKMTGDDPLVQEQKPAFLSFLKSVSFVPGSLPPGHPSVAASDNVGKSAESSSVDASDARSKPAWDAPANWQEVAPSQMLLAKFLANGADGNAEVTVSVFPGDAGGALANVNRWRGQIGLESIGQPEADKLVSSLDVMGGKAMLVDMSGTSAKTGKPSRLIGVIVPRGGQTWFYKLMGDPGAADREKTGFVRFVQSVRYPNA